MENKLKSGILSATEAKELDGKMKKRVKDLLPTYRNVAIHIADTQDTPERMYAKGCITKIVPWRESRQFMYWRLRRLVSEDMFVKRIIKSQDSIQPGQAKEMLRRWFVEDKGTPEVISIFIIFNFNILKIIYFLKAYQWDDDEKMTLWYESQNEENSTVWNNIEAVEENAITEDILNVIC